jgi:hypothetical protein
MKIELILKRAQFFLFFYLIAIYSVVYAKEENDCPDFRKYISEVVNDFAKEMERDHGLACKNRKISASCHQPNLKG